MSDEASQHSDVYASVQLIDEAQESRPSDLGQLGPINLGP